MADCGELKKKRSYAQGVFNRKANAIEFNMDLLNEHDLKLELRALKDSYEEICNSSFDYIAVMEEVGASEHDMDVADVKKRLHDCKKKYYDTEMKVKMALWSRYVLSQFGSQMMDLEDVFGQAEALQSGHLTHEQYDLVHASSESRVKVLEEFVRSWDHYVLEKEVDDMWACLKDYKEKRKMTIVALTNYIFQSKRAVHGNLGVLASGEKDEGDVDGGDDGQGGGDSGTAQADGVQSAGAGPATDTTATVTGSALDDNVDCPEGAQGMGPPSVSSQAPPQRHPLRWSTSPTF